jgi:hypothetical protein
MNESLERKILNLFVTKATKHQHELISQISNALVLKRQVTNIGFITKFTVPDHIETLATMSKRKVFEMYAEHPLTHAGAEFMLWFENGKLNYLEGYVLVGQWPNEEYSFHFHTHTDSLLPSEAEYNHASFLR